jgi:predicted aldo/keto reductase-like oxidoreductase
VSDGSFKVAAPALMTDLAAELTELKEMFRKSQAASERHLELAMKALSEAEPALPAGKALKEAVRQQLMVVAELSAVTTGLSDGFVNIFQSQLDQENAGEN